MGLKRVSWGYYDAVIFPLFDDWPNGKFHSDFVRDPDKRGITVDEEAIRATVAARRLRRVS